MEESVSLIGQLKKEFDCKEVDVRTYSPLALAYIGDSIYDVIIRTVLVERGNQSVNRLHKAAIRFVNAGTQARMIEALQEELTEEECVGNRLPEGDRDGSFAWVSVPSGKDGACD